MDEGDEGVLLQDFLSEGEAIDFSADGDLVADADFGAVVGFCPGKFVGFEEG